MLELSQQWQYHYCSALLTRGNLSTLLMLKDSMLSMVRSMVTWCTSDVGESSESHWSDPCQLQYEGAIKFAVLMIGDLRCGEGVLDDTMSKMIQLTTRVVRDKAIKVCMTERVKQNKVVITQDFGKASEVVNGQVD